MALPLIAGVRRSIFTEFQAVLRGPVGKQLARYPIRCIWDVPRPMTFENVVFPPGEDHTLPPMPKTPVYNPELGEFPYKTTKRTIEARGPELMFTELLQKQYGVVAVKGGFIGPEHFEVIRTVVNRNLNKKRFAIWRVEEPWFPRTRKRPGTKMGGGKPSIHHYETPVRSGRVIVEVGGYLYPHEAQTFLAEVASRMPFQAKFVTQQDLEAEAEEQERIKRENINKFDWDFAMKWNMQNCSTFLSKYEYIWRGKYR